MPVRVQNHHQRSAIFSFIRYFTTKHDSNFVSNTKHDVFWWNSTLTNFFRSNQVDKACQYFNQMMYKNVVTWNCMITGYIQNDRIFDAQKIFDAMPTKNVVSWTALMTGYAKCGQIQDARNLFDKIPERNVVCWNSMISGYLDNGRIGEARELFNLMPVKNSASWSIMISGYLRQRRVVEARSLFDQTCLRSTSIYNALLSGYVELGCLKEAEELFSRVHEKDAITWNSMITCYSRAGKMELARSIFDRMPEKDTISWTTIIHGYLRNGNVEDACTLFNEMPNRDVVAWNTLMGGFVCNDMLEDALRLFREMPKRNMISWNTILQGYVQQGDMLNARGWFDKMPQRSETSWNILISGYRCEKALMLFCKMVRENFKPGQGTLAVVIPVCASLVALGWGRMVHVYVIRAGYEHDALVMSSLISMYSRCGVINDSSLVFECMVKKDTISWNAIISTYAYHGLATKAFELFNTMTESGFYPDQVTYLSLLLACSYNGLVDEGCHYFKSMQNDWNLVPKPEHYSCVVDLLGRSGLVNQAYQLINEIPVELQSNAWETLLSACRFHGNLDIGEIAAKKVLHAQPTDAAMYILLSNIYAAKGMWKDAASVRALMRARGVKKETGTSWIEVKGKTCSFMCNDNSPLVEELCRELDNISIIMEDAI